MEMTILFPLTATFVYTSIAKNRVPSLAEVFDRKRELPSPIIARSTEMRLHLSAQVLDDPITSTCLKSITSPLIASSDLYVTASSPLKL